LLGLRSQLAGRIAGVQTEQAEIGKVHLREPHHQNLGDGFQETNSTLLPNLSGRRWLGAGLTIVLTLTAAVTFAVAAAAGAGDCLPSRNPARAARATVRGPGFLHTRCIPASEWWWWCFATEKQRRNLGRNFNQLGDWMNEQRIMTVKCRAARTLQVKTRSVRKTVACPSARRR